MLFTGVCVCVCMNGQCIEAWSLRRNSWSPANDCPVFAGRTDGGVVEKRRSDVIHSPP